MKTAIALAVVMLSTVALGDAPKKLTHEDLLAVENLHLKDTNERLTVQLLQLQQQLMECRAPKVTDERNKERAALRKRYEITDDDEIGADGTIVRKSKSSTADKNKGAH